MLIQNVDAPHFRVVYYLLKYENPQKHAYHHTFGHCISQIHLNFEDFTDIYDCSGI